MRNILITGANGFAGKYLCDYLRNPDTNLIEHTIEQADICNGDSIYSYVQKADPDEVYHLAGAASGGGRDKDFIYRVNVEGTLRLLESLAKLNRRIRVLLISSALVYGQTDTCANETSPVNPVGYYAQSKAEMEKKVLGHKFGQLEIIIARSSNHIGPGQSPGFVVPDFAAQIAAVADGGEMLTGNLESERDFLDVRDVARAYALIMERGISGEVYNVSSGIPVKIRSILDKMIEISGKNLKVKTDPARMRASDVSRNCACPDKLIKLGWKKEKEIDDTLEDIIKK